MKKILAIFMALVVFSSFAFFAIGSGDDSSPSTPNDSVTPDNDDTTAAPVKKISRGTILGDVYSNDYVGIKFTKPSDWTFLTDDELAEIINTGAELNNYTDLEMALAEQATVYDMSAMNNTTGDSVAVCYENTMLSSFRKVTEDEYIEILKDNLTQVNEISYTFEGTNSVTLGDTTFKRATFSAYSQGVSWKQHLYVKTYDKYVVSIIVSTFTEDLASIELMFS